MVCVPEISFYGFPVEKAAMQCNAYGPTSFLPPTWHFHKWELYDGDNPMWPQPSFFCVYGPLWLANRPSRSCKEWKSYLFIVVNGSQGNIDTVSPPALKTTGWWALNSHAPLWMKYYLATEISMKLDQLSTAVTWWSGSNVCLPNSD